MKKKPSDKNKKARPDAQKADVPIRERFIVNFALRFIPSYIGALCFLHYAGPYYARLIIHFMFPVIEWIVPEYKPLTLGLYSNAGAELIIQCSAMINGKLVLASIMASALYIKPIIIASILFAIPGMSVKNRLKAAVMAVALLLFSETIDFPFLLVGYIIEQNNLINHSLSQKILLFWEYFLDKGGRNFLALFVSMVSVLPFYEPARK